MEHELMTDRPMTWDELVAEISCLTAENKRLRDALEHSRGQWIHSVNAKECLAALEGK